MLYTPEDLSCVAIGAAGRSLRYPYGPTRISGLVDFHRADMGLTLVSSKASAWTDKSGKGHDQSQGTDANRPTRVTASLGGQDVLRFGPTAADIHLLYDAAWTQSDDATALAVFKYVSTGNGTALVGRNPIQLQLARRELRMAIHTIPRAV